MSRHRFTHVLGLVALLGLGLLFGGVVVAAQPAPAKPAGNLLSSQGSPTSTAAQGGSSQPGTGGLTEVTGNQIPEVVAYVDGHPITREALTQQIYIVQTQPQSADFSTGGDVVHVALQQLIQNRTLIDHAKDYGISATTDEARTLAQQQKAMFLQTDQGKQAIAPLAQQLGVSVEDYFDQPQVIQGYRDALTLSKMQNYVWNQVPADQRGTSTDWKPAAITKFVARLKAKVQILIPQK